MSRQTILDRLRRNPAILPAPPQAQTPGPAATAPAPAQATQFMDAWESLGGTCERHPTATAARLALLLHLRERNFGHILAWMPDNLPIPGLGDALADAGFTLVRPERRRLNPEIRLGLTGADAALAGGSLIFTLAPGRSWIPALVPISHIILLPAKRLYADLPAWRRAWSRAGREKDLCCSLVVTGPSYSDDIELHRHRGMFGPRHLHVILFDDDAERG